MAVEQKSLLERTIETKDESLNILREKNISQAGALLVGLQGAGKSTLTGIIIGFQEPKQKMVDTGTSNGSESSTKLITAYCKDDYYINVFDVPGDLNTKIEIYVKSIGDIFYKQKIPLEMLNENAASKICYKTDNLHTVAGVNVVALVITYEMLMNPLQLGFYSELAKELKAQHIPYIIIVNRYNAVQNNRRAVIPLEDEQDRKSSIDQLLSDNHFGDNKNCFYFPNIISRIKPFEIHQPLPIEALKLLIDDKLMLMMSENAKYIKVESNIESLMPKRVGVLVFEKKFLDFIYKNQFISILIVIILSLIIFIIQ